MGKGWGAFLGGLMDKLPIQGREERWKNELDTLETEKGKLLAGPSNEKTQKRMVWIMDRIAYLNQLLRNRG